MRKPAALEEGLGNGNPHDRLTGTCTSAESAHHPCAGVIRMRRSTQTSTCTRSEIKIRNQDHNKERELERAIVITDLLQSSTMSCISTY